MRMVLDSRGQTQPDAQVLQGKPSTLITTQPCEHPAPTIVHQVRANAEGRIDLGEWIALLRAQTYNEILVEAGPDARGWRY